MKTRKLLITTVVLALAATLAACSAPSQPADGPEPTPAASESPLFGVWSMTALEISTDGEFEPVPYSGQIVFGPESVSVQAMNPDIAAPDSAYTVAGYEAFYGDLTVDDEAGTWTVEVESAVARDLIGQALTRNYDVTDDTLVLTPVDESEGWQVTYERVSD